MHRCLLLDELFLHILAFLGEDDVCAGRRDVARLARTCKAFMHPALDLLWRTQSSLSPLVMCFPPQLWRIDTTSNITYLVQQPRFQDWARLFKYSRRVRSIEQPRIPNLPRLDGAILKDLLSPHLFPMLFPSLQALDFELVSVLSTLQPLLSGLLSPSFVRLSFIIPRESSGDALAELLHALPVRATSLRTLKITSFAVVQLHFTEHHWPHLQTLTLSSKVSITADSLRALMHLRNLRELSFKLPDDSSTASTCLAQPAFTALQRLKFIARSLDQCSDLLSNVVSPHLAYVSIAYDTQAPDHAFHAFLRVIARSHDRSPSFHTLLLRHNLENTTTIEPPFVMSPATLAPLLACHRLRLLSLANAGAFDFDDAFLAEAARAWPALRELRLISLTWFTGHRATLAGIRELVRHCPHLVRLHLPFDGRVLPDGDDGASSTDLNADVDVHKGVAVQEASLGVLNVCNSLISDPPAVARFLAAVAPRLKTLITMSDEDTRRKWREAQSLLSSEGSGMDDDVDH